MSKVCCVRGLKDISPWVGGLVIEWQGLARTSLGSSAKFVGTVDLDGVMSVQCVVRCMALTVSSRQGVAITGTCAGNAWMLDVKGVNRCWMFGLSALMTRSVLSSSRFWTLWLEGKTYGLVCYQGGAKLGSSGFAPSEMPLGDYRWHRRRWARVVGCLLGRINAFRQLGQRRNVGAIHLRRQFLMMARWVTAGVDRERYRCDAWVRLVSRLVYTRPTGRARWLQRQRYLGNGGFFSQRCVSLWASMVSRFLQGVRQGRVHELYWNRCWREWRWSDA